MEKGQIKIHRPKYNERSYFHMASIEDHRGVMYPIVYELWVPEAKKQGWEKRSEDSTKTANLEIWELPRAQWQV